MSLLRLSGEWRASNSDLAQPRLRVQDTAPSHRPPIHQHLRRLRAPRPPARELAGRDYYALRFHGIDNEAEAMEEAADWANYLAFGVLKRRREGRETHDDLALRAVFHIWQAYVATCEIQRKDAGAP